MSESIRSRITESGRIVIPAELRREFRLEQGQEVVFRRGADGLELLTVPPGGPAGPGRDPLLHPTTPST